ncbi:hypothetical protein ASPWEDRAFT_31317 [Aspergillus wentii DTO 134E9]|uniref:Gag1-like clamp domain-containing protein n=1 Tax=Aspergillus wentii DTO 134E9 TaxID=1073089 RepID=A0A1L9RBX0_ASPWE|nr:uncharacterized protein ASPWEDRAFT_31317 [Aspergillus wentii DTO 134E9]KAI9934969.1 hypothetical protein MW887_000590 [Aspergillus wentii]OJJ32410.1 hypothetical protein ASPWEDRAFT_31317 [Aspergillus wentii DTO 134E9]
MSSDSRDSAIRDAKRYIREIVRNDWAFEPSTSGPDGCRPASSTPATPEQQVAEWRLREFDSSGSELEPVSSPEIEPVSPTAEPELDYGFVLAPQDEGRRKRRRQMEEEMSWNEGLRTWSAMRDAWTGAQTRRQIRAKEKRKQAARDGSGDSEATTTITAPSLPPNVDNDNTLAANTEASLTIAEKASAEAPEQPSANEEQGEELSATADQAEEEAKGKESTETAITEPDSMPTSPLSPTTDGPKESEDPFIPVVPSLLSTTNPIRASITPSMYPSIYSKVVVQGLTPTVPINLADVTKAMVQGWKADGQWPPKPQNIVLADDATVPKSSAANGGAAHGHERKKSGVASAVRKVLNFSGFHPHPFHRRGSNSTNNNNNNEQAGEAASPV